MFGVVRNLGRSKRQLTWALIAGALLAALLSMQIGGALRVAALTATPSRTATPSGPADLVVLYASVTIPSSDCTQRSNLGTRATIKNQGGMAAGSFMLRINNQDVAIAGLAAGATTSGWVPGYRASTQTEVIVDANGQVAESNESNNTYLQQLPIPTPIPPCTVTPTPTSTSTSCQSLTISGRVTSTTTGAAISGAKVMARTSPIMRIFTATTAADGSYTLTVPGVSSYACTIVSLSAEATGYTTVTRSISSSQLRAQPIQNFSLWPNSGTPTATRTRSGTPPTATATRTRTPTRTYTPTSVAGTPAWAPNTAYAVGARVSYAGALYQCLQAHTSQTGWEPPNVPALWGRV